MLRELSVAAGCAISISLSGCATATVRPASPGARVASRSLSLGPVSCASAGACTAIGEIDSGSRRQLVAERWNGSAWSMEPIPTPADSDLTSVSCPSAGVCFAVGYSSVLDRGGNLKAFVGLIERWNGGDWSRQRTPRVSSPALDDISCATPAACTVVGSRGLPSDVGARPLVERWNGARWSLQRPAGDAADVAISCPSPTGCLEVGTAVPTVGLGYPVAERWSGFGWSRRRIPAGRPRQFDDLLVSGLSCASTSACVAVGSWAQCAGSPRVCPVRGRAWFLSGATWTVRPTPGSGYAAVSCVAADWCIGAAPRRLDRWDGRSWTTSFELTGAGQLAGVSCTSQTACLAVSADGRLAAEWNGTSWNPVSPPATSY